MLSKNIKIKIYRTAVWYRCEAWYLTLREEHRLSVLEKRVLRKGFGAVRDEVTGKWTGLHNEELYDLCDYSGDPIKKEMGSACGMHGGKRVAFGFFVRKTKGRNHLRDLVVDGRMILKWIFRKWGREARTGMIRFGRDRWRAVVNAVMNIEVS